MNMKSPGILEWEDVEIKRSALEARSRRDERLRLSERTLHRYTDPSKDTPYALEYAYHLLGDAHGKTVLDYGCGAGENSVLVAAHGADVIGVDISPDLVALADTRMQLHGSQHFDFRVASAYDLPLEDESVDIVFGMAILHHLDLELASREVFRVLKPGGRAVFMEPVRNSGLMRFVRGLIPYRSPDVSPFERPLTNIELDAFSEQFSATRARTFSLPFVNLIETLGFTDAPLHLAIRLDGMTLKHLPFLKKFGSVKVFEIVKDTADDR